MTTERVVVIGAGANGLACAFYLARAGLEPLVLERRGVVGGVGVTEEIAPGYRAPTVLHSVALRPAVARDLELERRGVRFLQSDPRLVALSPDGRALAFSTDVARTADAIRAFSEKDAGRYPEFCGALARLGAFFGALGDRTPPPIDPASPREFWELLQTGRRFRGLGRADAFRLLRWAPMAVADLVGEWFETELLQAAVAARGVFGTALGPWSAGSGAVLLMQAAGDAAPGGDGVAVAGGPGALTGAMADAAREAGAEVRTGAAVARVLTRDGRATGVALDDGREIPARAVVSGADPRRTFLHLVDPIDLDPGFTTKIRNYRCPGTVTRVIFALSGLPAFAGAAADAPGGRVLIGPSIDYLERAFDASKYGELPADPFLDIAIPSLLDPSLAPPGRHVASVVAQFTPGKLAAGASWDARRGDVITLVTRTLERYAPGFERLVEHARALTPVDLERDYGLTGGHLFHGELSLDQVFTMRPVLGWARYRTPVDGLYLCGAGTHGVPGLTAAQGRNAAREIVRDLKRRGRTGATLR